MDGDVDGRDVFDVRACGQLLSRARISRLTQDPPAAGDYVFQDGLRYARPYFFDYYAYVKTRWHGLSLLELFCSEFKGRSREYYTQAIAQGRLRVEDTSMSCKATKKTAACAAAADALRDGQRVRHFVHRHEPPVLHVPIPILATTDTAVVVCKPASMPVHPTARGGSIVVASVR